MLKSPFPIDIGFAFVPANSEIRLALHPLEQKTADSFQSTSRKAEFTAGRAAARLAAQNINIQLTEAILPSAQRYPIWPANILGSISHSFGSTVAAIGNKNRVSAIGLDIETRKREFNAKIKERILMTEEQDWTDAIPELMEERILRIFSAKECIYKAFSPILNINLSFKDAICTWNEDINSFECNISKDLGGLLRGTNVVIVSSNLEPDFILSALVLYK